jgi:hypothetical protein
MITEYYTIGVIQLKKPLTGKTNRQHHSLYHFYPPPPPPRCGLNSFLLLAIPIIFLALFTTTCTNPAGAGEGNVIISLPGADAAANGVARNVKPGAPLAARMAYTITCTGPGGVRTQNLAPGVTEATFRLAHGNWIVTASGTVDGAPIAHGSALIDVTGRSGQYFIVNLDFYTETDFDTDGVPDTHEYVENAFTVTDAAGWAAACAAIAGGGSSKNYIINVTGSVAGVTGVTTPSFGSTSGVKVVLEGGGSLALNAGGGSLLAVGLDQTVILRDITLTGIAANTAALVHVDGGSLAMHSGAVITGNTNTSGSGGVYFDGAAFTMSGDALVDAPGGVYLPAGKTVTVSGPLTRSMAATITPQTLAPGTAVLAGWTNQGPRFAVTPANPLFPWRVNEAGALGPNGWYAAVPAGSAGSNFRVVAVDSQGNAYCAGEITGNGPVDYGNGITYTGPAGGTYGNAVLVKYGPQGNALWVRGVTAANGSSYFNKIAFDPSGNVYVQGGISGSGTQCDFGLGSLSTVGSGHTGIIVKYSSGGTPQYQTAPVSIGSSSWAGFSSIAVDSSGNVYASDMNYGNVRYGTGCDISGSSSDTSTLVKYDSTLTAQWVRTGSPGGTHCFFGLAVDAAGNIYTGGYNNGSALVFGTGTQTTPLSALGSGYSAIIVKWDAAGNALWAKKASGGSNANFGGLAVHNGAVYATGHMNGTASRDYGGGISAAGPSSGDNAVLVKFDAADGAALWAKTAASGGGAGVFNNLAVDGSGIYVAGYQTGTTAFGYGSGVTAAAGSTGKNSLLIKYDHSGTAQYAHTVSAGAADSQFTGVTLHGDSLYLAGYQQGTGTYTYVPGPLAGSAAANSAVVMWYRK